VDNSQLIVLIDELLQYGKELSWLEFKRNDATDNQRFGKYISGLANAANIARQPFAYLVFGIDNDNLDIIGTTYKYDNRKEKGSELDFYIRRNLSPTIDFQHHICDYKGKRLEIFQIPASGNNPIAFENEAFIRIGSNLTELKKYPDLLRQILNSHIDWSAQIVENSSVNDLDKEAIQLARQKFKNKNLKESFYADIDQWTDELLLDKMKITVNGKITNTALLLLGKPEAAHLLSPYVAEITWKLDTEEQAYEHFGMPFFLEVNKVLARIRNVVYKFFPDNQLVSVEVMKYDPEVILEALNNCIAHQDYRRHERIVVTEKINKLVFINGGGFYEGTADDYSLGDKTPRNYRNRWLAEAMIRLGMIDALGYGIYKMVKSQRDRYFPLPDYSHSSANEVILEIYGHSIDINYSKLLIEKKDELSLTEVILLDKVQKRQTITNEAALLLKKKKLIEGRKPNFYIASHIAEVTDAKAEYIKNRGFKDAHYKKLILDFIGKYGKVSKQDIDKLILDILPDILDKQQKENKIRNLIYSMHNRDESIENKGTNRNPVWVLSLSNQAANKNI
jgi:ATP-dependent DNA helicase RecG